MKFLHFLLLFFLIISSLLVFISKNPVYSVLYLVLTFCEASSILFIFDIEFLGLLFIIIYVGAIAVLFLFIIMMLQVKFYATKKVEYLSILAFLFFIFIFQLFLSLDKTFHNLDIFSLRNFSFCLDVLSNIDIFGQILYSYYYLCFLIGGLLLLISMIGSIVLTLIFSINKVKGYSFKQLSRFFI